MTIRIGAKAIALAIGICGTLPAPSPVLAGGKCPPPCRLVTPCPCPEGVIVDELQPVEPMPEQPDAQPEQQPEQPPEPSPLTSDALDQALTGAFDYASTSDMRAPNMFGDQFGGGGNAFAVQLPPTAVLAITEPDSDNFFNPNPPVVIADDAIFNVFVDGSNAGQFFANAEFPVTGTSGPFFLALAENAGVTSIVAVIAQQAIGEPGSLQYNGGTAAIIDSPSTVGTVALDYDYLRQPLILFVANPADGGIVGRTKIADDNNPLPRDRFIFNYDYFSNVPLTANGWNVSRFSPGFEKTFFNRMTSVEVRFPFASTLDSSFTQGAESSNTEFGDIHVTLKALFFGGNVWNVAGGLGFSLPTADDVHVTLPNQEVVVSVENNAVLLQPYLAALWTPNNRFFAQGWMQFNFDANGNPVTARSADGIQNFGRLTAQTLLQLDGQIGYWIIQRPNVCGFRLAGLAPFLELHYNTTLNDPDVLSSDGILIGSLGGRIDELNLTAGVVAQIGNNLNVNIGAVAPLRTGFDRFFDAQVGVRASYFFGPTARARNLATRVSNF